MFKKIIASVLYVAITANAGAEVISLKFTDTSGNIKEVGKDATYINPVGSVSFLISSGLDRKINMVLRKSTGQIVSDITSTPVGPMNTLNFNNKNYFGKTISTTFPEEGNYTLNVNIKDHNGDIVQTDSYNYVVDTTAPITTGNPEFMFSGWNPGTLDAFSSSQFKSITLKGNTDNNEKIYNVKFIAKQISETSYKKIDAEIDMNNFDVSIKNYPASILPVDQVFYDIGFELYDKAGNTTIKTKMFFVDNVRPLIEFSDVYNPILGGWEPYVQGMTVYNNPTKFRYRRKVIDHSALNGTPLKGWVTGYSYKDETYVYNDFTSYKPASYSYHAVGTKAGKFVTMRQGSLNYVLAEGVQEAPKRDRSSHYQASDGVWHQQDYFRTKDDLIVKAVKMFAEQRSYEQLAIISSGGTCIISVGEKSCVASTNYIYNKDRGVGRGYVPYATHLRSSVNGSPDNKFNVHTGYLYTYWDFNGGEFVSTKINNNIIDVNYFDQDRTNNWTAGMWKTSSLKLKATLLSNGSINEINAISFIETTYNQYKGKLDLTLLEDGIYKIEVVATDSYGNQTVKTVSNTYIVDTVSPKILITNNGETEFTNIIGLDGIDITVEDDNSIDITELVLSGGPDETVVYMSWRETSEHFYKLEYPKIFPSLSENDKYNLTVKTKDSSGNTSEKTVNFIYKPKGLHKVPTLNILATDVPLNNNIDIGYNIIKYKGARTINGQLAHGIQEAYFTLNQNSNFSVKVKGLPVSPGQTVIIPLNARQGTVSLPVYPTENQEGVSNYLLEIFNIISSNKFISDSGYITNEAGVKLQGETIESVKKEFENMDTTIINKAAVPGLTALVDGLCQTVTTSGTLQFGLYTPEKLETSNKKYLTEAEKQIFSDRCEEDTPDTRNNNYQEDLQACMNEIPDYIDVIVKGTPEKCSSTLTNTICNSVTNGRISILPNGKTCSKRPLVWGSLCRSETIDEGILVVGFEGALTCIDLATHGAMTINES